MANGLIIVHVIRDITTLVLTDLANDILVTFKVCIIFVIISEAIISSGCPKGSLTISGCHKGSLTISGCHY